MFLLGQSPKFQDMTKNLITYFFVMGKCMNEVSAQHIVQCPRWQYQFVPLDGM